VQLILQAALVTTEQLVVATDRDVPGVDDDDLGRYTTIGHDVDPVVLASVPLDVITSDVATKMAVQNDLMVQPGLWYDRYANPRFPLEISPEAGSLNPLFGNSDSSADGLQFFASSIASDADTGVLRYHALRFNSSIKCDETTPFPSVCSGSRPFLGGTTLTINETDYVQFRWCVPGAYDVSPWTLSRDRQDIAEELFIDVVAPRASTVGQVELNDVVLFDNFSLHCTSSTTRGYFELPSNSNNHQAGPLLEKWLTPEELAANFNDKASDGHAMQVM
jgi:hypothetical protein